LILHCFDLSIFVLPYCCVVSSTLYLIQNEILWRNRFFKSKHSCLSVSCNSYLDKIFNSCFNKCSCLISYFHYDQRNDNLPVHQIKENQKGEKFITEQDLSGKRWMSSLIKHPHFSTLKSFEKSFRTRVRMK